MKLRLFFITTVLLFSVMHYSFSFETNSEDKEFTFFLKDFKSIVKSGDIEKLIKLMKFPFIIGSGGDAFYNYVQLEKEDFTVDYFTNYIIKYRKELSKISFRRTLKIIKDGANLSSFNFGANENGESDSIDYAASVLDGTVVYQYEFCDGDDGPCIGYFFSKFDGIFKIWGITYGR